MKSINSWSTMSESILDKILEGATQYHSVMKPNYIEYLILYPNGYGFSISKISKKRDKWEIVMVKGDDIDECGLFYESEITNFDVVNGLSDEDVVAFANKIKEYKE